MILNNYYYYFKQVLSNKFCDEIIQHAKIQKKKLALVGNFSSKKNLNKKDIKEIKSVRNSNVVFLNDYWIYKEIQPFIHQANRLAGWNFDWDFSESCQFTEYKKNQFYHWHEDSFSVPYISENKNYDGKIRKLSVTCSLSDSKNYEGGELQFIVNDGKKVEKNKILTCHEILPRGSIVVFPSFLRHRVKPVTKGVRYSLVIWNLGYPFK